MHYRVLDVELEPSHASAPKRRPNFGHPPLPARIEVLIIAVVSGKYTAGKCSKACSIVVRNSREKITVWMYRNRAATLCHCFLLTHIMITAWKATAIRDSRSLIFHTAVKKASNSIPISEYPEYTSVWDYLFQSFVPLAFIVTQIRRCDVTWLEGSVLHPVLQRWLAAPLSHCKLRRLITVSPAHLTIEW